jgi:hypothetical protein
MAPNKVLQVMFAPFRAPPATEPKHWASLSSSHCETSFIWCHGRHAHDARTRLRRSTCCSALIAVRQSRRPCDVPVLRVMVGGSNGAASSDKDSKHFTSLATPGKDRV